MRIKSRAVTRLGDLLEDIEKQERRRTDLASDTPSQRTRDSIGISSHQAHQAQAVSRFAKQEPQRFEAMVGARIIGIYAAEAKERMRGGGKADPSGKGKAKLPDPGSGVQAREQAAAAVKVSPRSVPFWTSGQTTRHSPRRGGRVRGSALRNERTASQCMRTWSASASDCTETWASRLAKQSGTGFSTKAMRRLFQTQPGTSRIFSPPGSRPPRRRPNSSRKCSAWGGQRDGPSQKKDLLAAEGITKQEAGGA
jgi:hypothetical protein